MTKEVKTGLIIGGLLLLGSATFAAVRYKRQKGRNLLDDLLKNLPKKKSSVVADDPISNPKPNLMRIEVLDMVMTDDLIGCQINKYEFKRYRYRDRVFGERSFRSYTYGF